MDLALFDGMMVCRTVVRAGRVCFGFVRGNTTVDFLDRGLAAEAHRAAIAAAERADVAGLWA